jgi:hypothetical protein
MSEAEKKKPKKPVTFRQMTVAQKAEAAALWRTGTVTLEDLGKRYKKQPETLSRLFTRMGIVKGSGAEEAVKKVMATVEARTLSDTEETMRKIAATRNEHFLMSSNLAKIAWAEILRARQAKVDIGTLKDVMMALKLAGDVIGNARKELFAVLDVEKHAKEEGYDHLPELTVRELTTGEMLQLQSRSFDDEMGLDADADAGADMMPDDFAEGP